MKKSDLKRYVVRKYVMATSAHQALRKERKIRPDDVYVDDDWKKENPKKLESAIGFSVEREYED
jgi:hypothetical protein